MFELIKDLQEVLNKFIENEEKLTDTDPALKYLHEAIDQLLIKLFRDELESKNISAY